jgi:hypothetical protein
VAPGAGWRAARAYAANEKLAALTIAGSVGAGLADRFSDLELDCYWFDPPSDLDRAGPVHVLGGELEALWDYDHDEEEWSDEYRLGELEVTVSSFLVSTIDRFVDDVVLRTDTDPVKHMRVARAAPFPSALRAGADQHLAGPGGCLPGQARGGRGCAVPQPGRAQGLGAREALADRGDDLAVRRLLLHNGCYSAREAGARLRSERAGGSVRVLPDLPRHSAPCCQSA